MADKLMRETQVNSGEFASPVPQYWNPVTSGYEKAQGGNGAPNVTVARSILPDGEAIPTRGAGMASFQTNAVTVTAGQVELKTGASAMPMRKQLLVYPPPAGTIYWGPTGVTAASGAPLVAGDPPLTFDLDPASPLGVYAVSDGIDRVVRVVEAK